MKFLEGHLAYCTNVHPAESWEETFAVLKSHTLAVRDKLLTQPNNVALGKLFAIGLRLSARAAQEILDSDNLQIFKQWLTDESCYVFTINGFPYGDFHGTRVKEKVYHPDWAQPERLIYTQQLFAILSAILPTGIAGSVSTLPGSFKEFKADENRIFQHLYKCAQTIETLSSQNDQDLHLGLEPEPLGHFENTAETLAFFQRFQDWAKRQDLPTGVIQHRIGLNYDTCHFALEFEDCRLSLAAFEQAGIRISKIHLSSAIAFNTASKEAIKAVQAYQEPTYLHQVITRDEQGVIRRYKDLIDYPTATVAGEGRCHFHIPLYATPEQPLDSTQEHALEAIRYCKSHTDLCQHFEIETYTWGVLPKALQIPIEEQIYLEYQWVVDNSLA